MYESGPSKLSLPSIEVASLGFMAGVLFSAWSLTWILLDVSVASALWTLDLVIFEPLMNATVVLWGLI